MELIKEDIVNKEKGLKSNYFIEDANDKYIIIKDKETFLSGLMDYNKKIVVEPKYDSVSFLTQDLLCVQLGVYKGICSVSGEEIIKPEYMDIKMYNKNVIKATDYILNYDLYNLDGNLLNREKIQYMESSNNELTVFVQNNAFGIMDKNMKTIINPGYDGIEIVNKKRAIVRKGFHKYLLNIHHNHIISSAYNEIFKVSDDCLIVYNGQYKIINSSNRIIKNLERQIDGVKCSGNGMIGVICKRRYQLLDSLGNLIVPETFEDIDNKIINGSIKVKYNGKWGIVYNNGRKFLNLSTDKERISYTNDNSIIVNHDYEVYSLYTKNNKNILNSTKMIQELEPNIFLISGKYPRLLSDYKICNKTGKLLVSDLNEVADFHKFANGYRMIQTKLNELDNRNVLILFDNEWNEINRFESHSIKYCHDNKLLIGNVLYDINDIEVINKLRIVYNDIIVDKEFDNQEKRDMFCQKMDSVVRYYEKEAQNKINKIEEEKEEQIHQFIKSKNFIKLLT